ASALLVHWRARLPGLAIGHRLVSSWWGVPALTLPLALIGAMYPNGMLTPALSVVPSLAELVHYGVFYAFGWIIYMHRDTVLPRLAATCGRKGALGLVAFIATLALLGARGKGGPYAGFATAFAFNCVAWYWSLGLIGAFSKFTSRQTPWMRYLSDSSYWVYLVHMLGTIGFGILLYDAPLNAAAKMAINIAATTVVCLVSYQLLVRHTMIGVLLNGRRAAKVTVAAPAYA
ncbi:MAG: acyltransferase family protein, partial [Telluria sp.]